jgi:hypothetical protein
MDYSKGRYNVIDSLNRIIGRIDEDEFVRDYNGPNLLYRIDGDEIYSMTGELLGFISSGIAKTPQGKFIFKIEEDYS